jgi:probable rRNA maturation factor
MQRELARTRPPSPPFDVRAFAGKLALRMPVLVSRSGVSARTIGSAPLRSRAERMLRALELPRAELSVLLCDDATIHALNRQHRRKDKPTDVLAFALREGKARPPAGAAEPLGDVVISLDTARRQAEERQRTLWDEVTLLLAHGLLHLVGYDHRTRAEERVMNARADVLVAAARAKGANTPRGALAPRGPRSDVDKRSRGIALRPSKGRGPARKTGK